MKFIIRPDGVVQDENGKVLFRSSVSQEDAREAVHSIIDENGFYVKEEWEMDDYSIELTTK